MTIKRNVQILSAYIYTSISCIFKFANSSKILVPLQDLIGRIMRQSLNQLPPDLLLQSSSSSHYFILSAHEGMAYAERAIVHQSMVRNKCSGSLPSRSYKITGKSCIEWTQDCVLPTSLTPSEEARDSSKYNQETMFIKKQTCI